MKLRERLVLNTVLMAAVLAPSSCGGILYVRGRTVNRTMRATIDESMAGDGRARCEAQAEDFGGPIPGRGAPSVARDAALLSPQVWAYDAAFHSANPSAPPFPRGLVPALTGDRGSNSGEYQFPSGVGQQLALRLPWGDGPCAILLGRFPRYAPPFAVQFTRLAWLCAAWIAAALLAGIPTISRIRRLSEAVQKTDSSRYVVAVPVSGDDEIGDLERAFNRAADRVRGFVSVLEQRETALRSTVSNTTHAVTVPLTVVQGHLARMQAQLATDAPAQDGLRSAIRETHYLAALLRNLDTAAQFEGSADTLERRPLDLAPVLDRVVARHQFLAETLGVELAAVKPTSRLQADVDPTLLERAVGNLVHNAVSYNRRGGHVVVSLALADHGQRFSVRVTDDGPGMSAAERARVSEPAFRGAEGRASRPEGRGLGLHIARVVTERHGFEFHVQESASGGAEFRITGPAQTITGDHRETA